MFGIVTGTEVAEATSAYLLKFNARQHRAHAIIFLSTETKLLYIIGDPTDPTVWDKLPRHVPEEIVGPQIKVEASNI